MVLAHLNSIKEVIMNTVKIETIFDLMKNKEPRAFELLYEQHFRIMYGIAYSVTGNDELSKDAVQNTIIKLFVLESHKFPKAHALTWLYVVVKNEALMLLRKEKQSIDISTIAKKLPVIDKGIEEFADMENYYTLISSLNKKQQQIVTLKVLGGMSHKEISHMLQKPIGTIQWTYNMSIKKLRIALSTMAAFVITLGTGFVYKLIRAFNTEYIQIPEMDMEPPVNIPTPPRIDAFVIVFGVCFLLSVTAWIVFFKNSDKLPTKRKARRI
jgi:RNA polymerase sigma factor (sigma-70 family)